MRTQPLCSYDGCVGEAGYIEGVKGKGFKFNESVYIELDYDDFDVLGSDNFEISMWVKTDKDTIGDILSKGNSSENWFTITQRNSRWKNEVWGQFDDGIIQPKEIKSNYPLGYVWTSIRLKYERIDEGWIISYYLYNNLINKLEFNNYGLLNNTYPLFLGTSCGNIFNGNEQGCYEYWGAIDELVIRHKDNVLVYYTFDEDEGNKIIDSSGNGNHGIIKIKE